MAVFCSWHYHDGLPGCGWKTACGLAQYGVGDELLRAAQAHSLMSGHEGLKDYIHDWADRVREILVKDPLGHIGRRHPKFLDSFPNNFPEVSVVLAYVKPAVNQHNSDTSQFFISSQGLQVPDLQNLAYLCPVKDAESMGTMGKLKDYIWPGVCIRVLLEYRVEIKSRLLITAAKKGVVRVQRMAEWTPAESATIIDSITNSQPDLLESTSWVWVPAPLVDSVLKSSCRTAKRPATGPDWQPDWTATGPKQDWLQSFPVATSVQSSCLKFAKNQWTGLEPVKTGLLEDRLGAVW
ncbi:hypothetical protein EV702DRAFT_1041347 [Suillus placidus]|uniref:Uncharacterized protein n=1 Tax=Suillus placidus TaxID=48579 RepID=A0A9P7A4W6_9AGAM|nr:hypothetical protein EV702DRAFT_1041347 [Suillus placidus]